MLVGEAAGEGYDGALGRGVVKEIGAADVGVDGGAVDDGVAGFHVLEGVFGDVEHRVDVGVEGLEPLVSVKGPLAQGIALVREEEEGGVLCKLTNAVDHVLIGGVVDDNVDSTHV